MDKNQDLYNLMIKRFQIFALQDPKIRSFDVVFEIGEKKLYAHSFMLTSVSTTFNSMRSSPRKNGDDPIKIETYSFEDFKEFITFIYAGECKLTKQNIFAMFDIAKFFNVEIFKNACDLFLYKDAYINFKNVFLFLELSQKYSLVHQKTPLNNFIEYNLGKIITNTKFLILSKSAIKEIIEISKKQRKCKEEIIFKAVHHWAEKHAKLKIFRDGNSSLKEIVKKELSDLMVKFNFNKMDKSFINDFVVPKSFLFTRSQINTIILLTYNKYDVKIIDNRGNAMKGELYCDISDFVFKTIQSLDDDERYARCIWLECTNAEGENKGNDDNNDDESSADYDYNYHYNGNYYDNVVEVNYYYWPTNRRFPSFPACLKANKKVPYYLIYDSEGDIGIKYRDDLTPEDYL